MSPEQEPLEREQADGPQDAARQTRDASRRRPQRDGEARLGGLALPRREPATRQAPPAASSPRLSLEQLMELRERLARLKAGQQPPPPEEQG